METQKTTSDRVLRLPEVKQRTGLGRMSIYLKEREGDFPIRITLGGRSVGWLASEVDSWIQTKAEARSKKCALANGNLSQN